ncbi:AAA family ATPase [Aliarcobacter butzleri]|uniref:ATP-dependent nuclease n=1 Tax=Aliarcobacter butzleri TaxID=28197 RepID=UPI00263D3658|nr:AAA family ATPase [Aliarcobacter butzleri]MDN5128685.1 AAA family ATPase [Aliarcobacter butzleri]
MNIKKVYIENFKSFKKLELNLNSGINILVGNNEAGKSTILEAIHLALTGLLNGKYLKNDLTEYLFNFECIQEYLANPKTLPYILIEIFFEDGKYPLFEGTLNYEKKDKESGISFKIAFDEKYQNEYNELLKDKDNIKTLPIEYYEIYWSSFSRDSITSRSIPIKSAFIDSSSNRFQNGSDVYLSRIIRENLDENDLVKISQAHRKMRDTFMEDESIQTINSKVKTHSTLTTKELALSVELVSKNAWESSLMTYFDDIPFHYIGKGEQCIIKTDLALSHRKSKESNLLLIEEPENHLSHTKLNALINKIKTGNENKQIIISTHSSFVANKLGLEHLIFLHDKQITRLDQLSSDTQKFFEKIAGYDTLRLILCKKAILVEGDSDELVIQKAYILQNNGKLPIEDEIDVISVGIAFKRFLEIAKKINKEVVVVTDSDGDIEAVNTKYENYLGTNAKPNIKICFDGTVDIGDLMIGPKPYNYNTLEPKILKSNSLSKLNIIFGTSYATEDELRKYMKSNKTECALKIFDTQEEIVFPDYIMEAIK